VLEVNNIKNMTTKPTADVDWHALDESDSDSSDSSSESEDNKSDHNEEQKVQKEFEQIKQQKQYSQNYGDRKGGYANRKQQSGFYGQATPGSNYDQFYKNDPDFFVKVMRKEEPPHELSIKINKKFPDAEDLSQDDFKHILSDFGVEDASISFTNNGGLRASVNIGDTEECVKIYSDLFDKLFSKVRGYRSNVYYQRDIQVLEAYADEEAENFYKNQSQQKEQPRKWHQ
jgi:hypothetical protein